VARPSRAEEHLLEQLEAASASLAGVGQLVAVLNVRLRAVRRRAGGQAEMLKVIEPAMEQLKELTDSLQLAQGLLFEVLGALQTQRNRDNRKRGT